MRRILSPALPRTRSQVEVALQWCSDSFSDTLVGFANSIRTIDGGSHIDGLKAALTRTVNSLARKLKLLKEGDPNLAGDHVREGLGGVVSVKLPAPEFEGQTKTRLGNPEVNRRPACMWSWVSCRPLCHLLHRACIWLIFLLFASYSNDQTSAHA